MLIFVLAGMNINDLIYFEDDCLINYNVNYSCIYFTKAYKDIDF